ncbi:rhomboid family intramembrane serine protease [Cryobacterium sp. TMT1-62]|uniref:rhomboid family intramembrane serine protease n=1 Tax=unclassified Cryobacterium TaxID=2649013 RepID=UPI000CE551D0|nr:MULTISPECIES: rhomboid family intramembrane serine protease [unclassified Cryobacterium]TFB55441.1 rhomboid family intramembrane serine protease [Cryobacterium sp. Sr3]TFB57534.1 rhomboid family intramembrane serine protease [Cryobacterium sp. Hz7]TFC35525.1 rhomboid family intramembrane serine protease [Cryobacterium sp. TMT2-14]TFC52977.1 rhomboid family intramembrane serine protease [Cryobacterium sp. TMT2-17-1]TFC64094.1 rhomboid family intramembrane serine protease [Cryobacterium sp. T
MTGLPGTAANFCYRHPGRQSYILCQRCGRTICPDCQTQGAVGVICPECMNEQRRNAPRTKPAILTRLKSTSHPVTTVIIGVTLAIYLLQFILGAGFTSLLWYAGVYSSPGSFEPWRMLTSVLVHGSIFHVLLNMYTLWIFGQILEGMLGRGRFLALYVLSGLAGSLGVLFLSDPRIPVVGASGAIFGLMGAFLIIQRRLGGNATQLLILVGINLVIGFLPGLNVAWQAHVGGLIAGAVVGLIFVQTRRIKQQRLQTVLITTFGAFLVVVSGAMFLT